ncbi:DUF3987 domain-containing protein [Lutibacter sp. HS1-25]|uniref:DUF3987 domain-containing protein n=1 Tax=Lutibacter sp. HS1-25 TaxID=2485000 RepID=UPI0013E918A6|nr:DUF3987 domain-containing protein [Lutibacter sp. HS1-25]
MNSTYINFGTKIEDKNIVNILQEIKSGKYKNEINPIRIAKQNRENSRADDFKKKLLAFTPSGTFGQQRKEEFVNSYSKIIHLDFDHIPADEMETFIEIVNSCEFTYASYISPSGEGVKVFVRVDSNKEQHIEAYKQVGAYYSSLTYIDYDPKCKDISRLCFVSFDENTFLNETSTIYKVKNEVDTFKIETEQYSSLEQLEKCLEFTEKKEKYLEGNRNNFIYLFACNANRTGINEESAFEFCNSNFDLEENEIKNIIKSAFHNNIADFAKFANVAKGESNIEENQNFLLNTPKIPQLVYDNLPSLISEGAKSFEEQRSKDTFLTGALSILSGCLPNVSGEYSGREVFPNLYSFILAPAASGKGSLQSAKELADRYHRETIKNSEDSIRQFKMGLEDFKDNESPDEESPKEPPFEVVYIPANTSNSKMIQHLEDNDGKGIICETEADTLGQAFKNDWGSYSDLLRKAFHHEKISVSRKTNNEYFEIEKPKLSVALSGTPKQVYNIISSAEDGLFSRFLFYTFKTENKWIDPSPYGNHINLTEHFSMLSDKVYEMTMFFENNETVVHLSREQWDKLNKAFSGHLEQINTFVGDDATSVVKRQSLILYRFCMVFSAIRKFENKNTAKDIECLDEDFESALLLINVYLKHSIIMYNNLPKQADQGIFKTGSNNELFFQALPIEFTRKEAVSIGLKFGLSTRSIDTLLKKCVGKYLEQPKVGSYKKCE